MGDIWYLAEEYHPCPKIPGASRGGSAVVSGWAQMAREEIFDMAGRVAVGEEEDNFGGLGGTWFEARHRSGTWVFSTDGF